MISVPRRLFCASSRLFVCDDKKGPTTTMKYWEHQTNEDDGLQGQMDYYSQYKNSYEEHMQKTFSHVDEAGKASMVDVGDKDVTKRSAKAMAFVFVGTEVFNMIKANNVAKGDVLSIAQIAGILGAKKTSDLIPLCHPLALTKVNVDCRLDEIESKVIIECEAKCISRTGVEMEALTGASIAALTVYDMCKAVNKAIVISDIRLIEKTGGKSGLYKAAT
jgi:molybdenum cofactor biosynthesis protein MoaC